MSLLRPERRKSVPLQHAHETLHPPARTGGLAQRPAHRPVETATSTGAGRLRGEAVTVALDIQADYALRGADLDALFGAQRLSDTCIDAIARVSAQFDSRFPGWPLYRRVAGGSELLDRQLEAWAISSTRMLARAQQKNGHPFISERIRRPDWIAQAGRDALDYALYGRYPASARERGARFGIHHETFVRLRDPVAKSMWIGIAAFRSALHAEYWQVRRDEKKFLLSVASA